MPLAMRIPGIMLLALYEVSTIGSFLCVFLCAC